MFIAKDGSLASIIKVDGIKQVLGADELDSIIENMNLKMSSYLVQEGHAIQVWFARDKDLSRKLIKDQTRPQRNVASHLGLDLEDLFSERERHLPNFVTWEGFYIVLWTRLSVLTKKEMENAKAELKAPKLMPTLADAQDPFRIGRSIKDRHKAFTQSFLTDLKDIQIRASLLDTHQGMKAMKWSIYPDLVGADWQATLPGDPLRERVPEVHDFDASHLLWPRIEDQLFDREAERLNPRIVRVGALNFSAMDMVIGPQRTEPFSSLLNRMIEMDEIPWRVSFLIEGGGLNTLGIKSFLASIFQLTNGDNRQIREAIQELQESRQEGMTVTKFRVNFATWAPTGDLRLIEERSSRLQRSVESWGYCQVSPLVGDPLAAVMSSSVGLEVASTAPAGAVPLPDVITMLPWNRDASPWEHGAVLFRTSDGRSWPYQPGSSMQDAFIDLIFAPPGKGKSVYMNTTNLALCLSLSGTSGTGGMKLPRIAIIDIGPSSSGLISLLQEALPISRRHEVAYHRLRMTHEFAINPFDTQLGCRQPFPLEKDFLVNFLTTLGTDVGESKPPNGLTGIISAAIDILYDKNDDNHRRGQPKIYNERVCRPVDEAIRAHAIEVKPGITTWWDIVDALFMKGDLHSAIMAQRYAVPVLEEMMAILNHSQITDVHGEATIEGGERVVNVCRRVISSAIREMPILQRPTAFDIGDAHVVALDLDEVAPKGGAPANKQTALMYMLARFVLARDFYLNHEIVDMIPDLYRNHHTPRIRRIRETPKRLVYDEFHRTSKAPKVREQVLVDIREGRKWGVHVALASQLLQDFDDEMVDLASGYWIMGAGNDRVGEECAELFGLTPTAKKIVKTRLNGPEKGGAPFLAVLALKEGKHEHLLYNTLGPTEIWAFSTTPNDTELRSRMYDILGPIEARRRLASRFPNGSAKGEIDRRIAKALERGGMDQDDAKEGVIEDLAMELVNEGRK
ncbi:ATP-binding protein [Roseibium sp. RKSG952]|uniref:ATP-binding protein n=1 Tax=Roseibium sp. RKSG952 TaxID=2529384 RepID=UPI001AD8DC75|nr:ATP-binding protein [Roseibium sp. RKSG952]